MAHPIQLINGVDPLIEIKRLAQYQEIETFHLPHIKNLNKLRLSIVYSYYSSVCHEDEPFISLSHLCNLCSRELFNVDSAIYEKRGINLTEKIETIDGGDFSDKLYYMYSSIIVNLAFSSDLISFYRSERISFKNFAKNPVRGYQILQSGMLYLKTYEREEINKMMLGDITNS